MQIKSKSLLPGFAPTFGYTLIYLHLLVLLPLAALVFDAMQLSWKEFIAILDTQRVFSAFRISFGLSIAAGIVSGFFGLVIGWVLVKYRFPGRRLFDALIDLPFAMPTAVSGIALATLYAKNGWFGYYLEKVGIVVAFTPLGIFLALIFVSFPFVVRAIQPTLEDMEKEMEEAAACLGATRWQILRKVVFPQIAPSLLVGFSMGVARALGEYGSVIFIAGNIPYFSEIVPLLIVIKLEQFDYRGATVLAVGMLLASFALIFSINLLQLLWKKQWAK